MRFLSLWVPEMEGGALRWLEHTGEAEMELEKQRGQSEGKGLYSLWKGMAESELYLF